MEITTVNLSDKAQVRDFLQLPFRLYAENKQWVPPLETDMWRALDPKRNPFYRHSEAAFFLVRQNDLLVGRLAVLNNKPYNQYMESHTGFFWFFESDNNPEAAACLFEAAFAWARSQGLDQIYGPKGFTTLDGFGLLVKGFEHRPAFGLPYNPAYYVDLIEAQGFEMQGESLSGYMDETMQFPPRIAALAERLASRRGLRIARCSTRQELRAMIPYLKDMYNNVLEHSTGNVPVSDDELESMVNSMLWLADPKLIKIVMKGDKAVGFLLAYPDISAALQRTGGRLFPFGWLDLLLELRRTRWININGAGLLPEYQGSGGTAVLFSEIFKTVKAHPRYRFADIVQIGVENEKMQREMEHFGIDFYKRHRVYIKRL